MLTRTLFLALAFATGLAAQDNETPRQVFEKAAYAEEHERDFEKAEQLYRNAGSMALFLGDQALADDAMKAVKRLASKRGGGAETQKAQDVPIEVRRRLYLLVRQLSAPKDTAAERNGEQSNYDAMNQIIPFGAAAVPILEQALHAQTIVDPEPAGLGERGSFRGDSRWAAKTLARMQIPEAAAAFRTGLASADPFVRMQVVSAVDVDRHRAVLDEALKDSNPSIVAQAVSMLSRLNDPDLLDLMRPGLYRDDGSADAAARWMMRNRPGEAAAALRSPDTLAYEAFQQLLDDYVKLGTVGSSEKASLLLEAAESATKRSRSMELLSTAARVGKSFEGGSLPPALRARAESLALRAFEAGDPEFHAWQVVKSVGRLPTAEALAKRLVAGTLSSELSNDAASWIAGCIGRLDPADFPRAVAVVADVAMAVPTRRPAFFDGLMLLAQQGVGADALVAGHEALPDELRALYLQVVILKLESAPTPLLRASLALEPSPSRRQALVLMSAAKDPATLGDAAKGLSDVDPGVRSQASKLFAAVAPKDPARALALLEDLFRRMEPAHVRSHLNAPAVSLPVGDVVAAAERCWQEASPERRAAVFSVMRLVGRGGDDFLMRHFDAGGPEDRAAVIGHFSSALYEPALDLIGKALTDPDPKVRATARDALMAFREHREALEEFRRWQTGDAEARASIADLMKLLDSPNRDVVVGAVKALAAVKAKAALPALVTLLGREDPVLKKAVEDAIAKIGE